MRQYFIWKTRTCWVCREGGALPPLYHAAERYPALASSPCATVARQVWARDRLHALRVLRGKEAPSPAPIPWWQKALQTTQEPRREARNDSEG